MYKTNIYVLIDDNNWYVRGRESERKIKRAARDGRGEKDAAGQDNMEKEIHKGKRKYCHKITE